MTDAGAMYKGAGVDIDAGDQFAREIANLSKRHSIKTDVNGFSGLFPIPTGTTMACGSVDGVGTKLTLLKLIDQVRRGGIDAVAMAGVDVYVSGRRPVAVFDYIATEHLNQEELVELVDGIMFGCKQLMCSFMPGGETAEHPNIGLPGGHVDLAVFVVGIPDPKLPANPQEIIKPGMTVWGWLSRGLGSNGYSLARSVFGLREGFWSRVLRAIFGGEYGRFSRIKSKLARHYPELGTTLDDALLHVTQIYVPVIELQREEKGVEFAGHLCS